MSGPTFTLGEPPVEELPAAECKPGHVYLHGDSPYLCLRPPSANGAMLRGRPRFLSLTRSSTWAPWVLSSVEMDDCKFVPRGRLNVE